MSYNETYMNFIGLIKNNELEKAKQYLKVHNIDINMRPTVHDKITVSYAKLSNKEIVKYLLEELNGSPLAFLDTVKLEPCKEGIDKLIAQGINKEILYKNCFIHACSQGALDIAEYMLSKNVDIYASNEMALRLACKNNQLHIVKYLLKKDFTITEQHVVESCFNSGYFYLIEYPTTEQHATCEYLLKNYQFKEIDQISDQLIEVLTYRFAEPYSDRKNYEKVFEIVKNLSFIQNASYTDKTKKLLENETALNNLFVKKELYKNLNEMPEKEQKSSNIKI